MKNYQIQTRLGFVFGIYSGETPEDAINKMLKELLPGFIDAEDYKKCTNSTFLVDDFRITIDYCS